MIIGALRPSWNIIRGNYPSFCPWTQMVAEMATDNDDMITGSPSVIMNGVRSKTTGN